MRLDNLPSPSSMPPLDVPAPPCGKKKQQQNHQQPKRDVRSEIVVDSASVMPSLDGAPSQSTMSHQRQRPQTRPLPQQHDIGQCIFRAIEASLVAPDGEVHVDTFRSHVATFQCIDMKATTLLEMISTVRGAHLPREMLQNAWLRIVEEERQDLLELSTSTPPRSPRATSPTSTPRSGRPSTSGATTKLSLAKSKRKQVEYDARLLANRLALLQQEEIKAWRKIEQTREKAAQILEHREEIFKKQQDKHMLLHEKEQNVRVATKKHKLAAKTSVIRKRQAAISVISKKYQEVESVKLERRRLKQAKEQQAMDEVNKAKEKRQRVRQQEDEMRKKKLQEKLMVEKQVVARYRKSVEDEEMQLREQQKRVAEMERAEMELIQRLQSTQLLQRQAYDELEKALVRTDVST
ncbi:hypothetical protein H310_14226 [Aphanomyces invadans]|uniref:Uncharacterized protein n=1 Tax=Aphanomyces invadans TaxID=157072 RepID=A0A024TC05_9STRA|nr:hypothetical protein H310_14226 [Aphanomyces invadans]ETV91131.1 hypothetical protein H310_14226 [Aphanomyces invadans]|eukprot:XP_008880258.1 hypothetical protein H310_14226 [Aphanomyces invadans]